MGKNKTLKKIDTLNPQKDDIFLLDTCVLLFIFYTSGGYRKDKVKRCGDLFNKIIQSDAKILIVPELISEFFNKFIKLEYDTYVETNGLSKADFTFKEFRCEIEFNNAIMELKEIYNNQILPYSKITKSNTEVNDIYTFLDSLAEMDFNDRIYCSVSKENNAKLITADTDFILSDYVDEVDLYFL